MDTKKLANELRSHRKRYYEGKPIIPDWKFDLMEDQLRKLDPNDEYFHEVGSKETRGDKVTHLIKMLSMNKVNSIDGMKRWVSLSGLTEKTILIGEPKIDGISVTFYYDKDGTFLFAATRGDGTVGVKIHFVTEITGFKRKVNWPYGVPFQIRGELAILKKYRDQIEGESLRNYCFGLLNRVKKSPELKFINFLPCEIVTSKNDEFFKTTTSMMEFLAKQFPTAIPFFRTSIGNGNALKLEDFYYEYLQKYREEWPYQTDGLVFVVDDRTMHARLDSSKVVSHHHHYNIAFKPPAENGEAPMEGITIEVSRNGNLIPVGVIKPTKVGDVTITNMTLNNARNLRELQLHIGDVVQFERANDVIPKFIAVLKRNPEGKLLTMPNECPSCGRPVKREGVHIRCINRVCPDRVINHILYWVRMNKIKNFGRETIEALFKVEAVRSITDLYTVNLKEVLSLLPGFNAEGTKIPKLIAEIERSRTMTELEMLSRFGIPGCGEKVLKSLHIQTLDDLAAIQFLPVHDLQITRILAKWIGAKTNYLYLQNLRSVLNIQKPGVVVKAETPAIGVVCITGAFDIPRSDLVIKLQEVGYEIADGITKKVTVLLAAPGETSSSKYERAVELGIPIVHDYNALIKG